MATTRTDARIARLETRLDAIDAALAALAATDGGIEEYEVEGARWRRSNIAGLERIRERLEGELSGLEMLKLSGGKSYVARGRN